jgi:hypothetical protein
MSKWRDSDYSNIVIGGTEDTDVVMTSVEAAFSNQYNLSLLIRSSGPRT